MEKNVIAECVNKYGSPMYLYDGEKIINNCNELSDIFGSKGKMYYSMKANPLIGICQLLNRNFKDIGVETASIGEINGALIAGIKPDNIIFTSPGKTRDEITYAIEKKIKLINVDSLEEILIINEIASKNKVIMPIAIRVNPNFGGKRGKMKMSGVSSQFGIDENILSESFWGQINELANINLVGIQIYMETCILEAEEIAKNTKHILELAFKLEDAYNLHFKSINVGGGFGVPYFENDTKLDLDELKELLNVLLEEYKNRLKNIELIYESGRYIIADSGVFVTKVLYCKESKGSKYIVCDGGANFHASSAFLGRFIRDNFPMYVLGKANKDFEKVNVTGPLCMPTDILGKNVMLDKDVRSGDYIIIDKSGAYGFTYSPSLFLSHESPVEVLKLNNKYITLREKCDKSYFLINQNSLDNKKLY